MKFVNVDGKMYFISEIESHSDILYRVQGEAKSAGFVQFVCKEDSCEINLYGKSTTLKIECNSENDNSFVSEHMKFTKDAPVRFFIFHGQYLIFTSEKDDISLIGSHYSSDEVVTGLIHLETEESTDPYSDFSFSPVLFFSELSRELTSEELFTLKVNLRK